MVFMHEEIRKSVYGRLISQQLQSACHWSGFVRKRMHKVRPIVLVLFACMYFVFWWNLRRLKLLKTQSHTHTHTHTHSGISKNFEKGGSEDNLSAPSSLMANAHNEIYALYTEKAAF